MEMKCETNSDAEVQNFIRALLPVHRVRKFDNSTKYRIVRRQRLM